ncbi:MAG: DAK2 domain-containing protein [Christensenellaceae bacterium]|jgi:DAK2 domain fusion protein YloV|nr:DAK2 domain-containing protein [Christensenellaceae bacterium]
MKTNVININDVKKAANASGKKKKERCDCPSCEVKRVNAVTNLSGAMLKKIFIGGYNLLDKNKEAIDNLNVFPVPDGDTGHNMALTMKSVVKEIDGIVGGNITELAEGISKGALKGARGNSGVITSQILKGMASVFGKSNGKSSGKISTKTFALAMTEGAKVAYSAVTVPKEGTILTIIRVMAEEAEKIAKVKTNFLDFFASVIEEGERILAKTPDMLPVLKKAGVVDAGGRGIITIFRGFLAVMHGKEEAVKLCFDADSAVIKDTAEEVAEIENLDDIEFAYCTEFFITSIKKTTMMSDIDAFREKLMSIGDSAICVGDLNMVKVHVHTNEPNIALGEALRLGEVSKIKIENMLEQNRELRASRNIVDKEQGIVAVSNGEGLNNLFKELGVDFIIKGGQTMNPSSQEIATAADRVHAKNVFIFPNNKNIILSAMNAQSLTDKHIIVIPTKTINEGVASIINFSSEATVEENTSNFIASSSFVKSASVTYAVRDTKMDKIDIKQGDIIGLDDKSIVVKGKSVSETTVNLVSSLINETIHSPNQTLKNGIETVTLFFGEGVKQNNANEVIEKLQKKFPNIEFSSLDGGQSVYYYLISLE